MSLSVYNTLSRKKEVFKPVDSKTVNMYVCGVTVYDYCHIGHARANCVFDVIHRYLLHLGYDVHYIQNFTDIDDKIINRAKELEVSIQELTEKFIHAYFEDMDRLHIQRANLYPRATQYIQQMLDMISILIEKGYAYENSGDVVFAVEKYKEYGQLSGKILDDLISGARVDISDRKKNPLDFVLWKKAKPKEPFWNSPWGKGRPGWHIECSVMAITELSETLDIHGGGADLIFPHHENEIAQSQCCTGKPFAQFWIHNGFVNIDEEKMSKSKNNFFTIREILEKVEGEYLRFYLLRVHYRKPFNFSMDGLEESSIALDRLYNTLRNVPKNHTVENPELTEFEQKFYEAMNDDFNYAEAIGVLFELNKWINKNQMGLELLLKLGKILGLFNMKVEKESLAPSDIQAFIDERNAARKSKNFKRADEIRDLLKNEHNVIIEDTSEGVRWKKIKT